MESTPHLLYFPRIGKQTLLLDFVSISDSWREVNGDKSFLIHYLLPKESIMKSFLEEVGSSHNAA